MAPLFLRARLGDWYSRRRPGWQILWMGSKGYHRGAEVVRTIAVARRMRRELSQLAKGSSPNSIRMAAAEEPRLSVVIPVPNGFQQAVDCIGSVAAACRDIPAELIAVSDRSTGDLLAARLTAAAVRVVLSDAHLSYARAVNLGARAARGEFLLVLRSDTLTLKDSLHELVRAMSDTQVGAAGPRLLSSSGRLKEAGRLVWRNGALGTLGHDGRLAAPEYKYRRDVDCFSSAALMMRVGTLRDLGYFDEEFGEASFAAADVCFKIRASGRRVVYEPTASVVQVASSTPASDPRGWTSDAAALGSMREDREAFVAKWGAELALRRDPPGGSVRELPESLVRPLPKLLVCDWVIPAADRDSTSHRMDAILRVLVPMTSRVTFMPMVRGANNAYARALQEAGVEVMSPAPRSFETFLRSRAGLYDVVILSRMAVAKEWLEPVRRTQRRATVVFDTVDLHSVRYAREQQTTGTTHVDPQGAEAIERMLIAGCDITAAITEPEAEAVRRLAPSAKTVVLPNVHEMPQSRMTEFAKRSGLLFIGSFLHSPNVDALTWFASEILPLIRRRLDVDLIVIGEDPPPSLMRACGRHVSFAGWVEDVQPLFDQARVFVAPLRFGAGMKGKIGQALSYGLPTVTTSIGAEGMDLADGRHALIRDDPIDFAEGVVELYRNAALWDTMCLAGRQIVRDRWTPEAMRGRLAELLRVSSSGA